MSVPDDTAGRQRVTLTRTTRASTEQPTESFPGADGARGAVVDGPELFRLLVESVRDYAIFALDPEGNILTWSAGAQRIKGYAPSEIIGRHFSVFYPPEDIAAGKPANELVVAARDGRVEDEGWRLRKGGTPFWASVVITALRDETGTLVGFGKVTRDLTDRRMGEEALRQSEERFRLLVERVRDYAIFMLDPEGRIASWNAGAEAINGYREAEILGRHFSVFYTAEDVANGKPKRELEIASRTGVYEEEGWRVRKDGTVFWSSVVITAVRTGAGKLIGYAKVTRDLTERRAAQERAIADARRVAEAEAASRTKSEFLTAMSHELRTPINATMGYAQLLETEIAGPITDRQRKYLARLRGSQEHLLHIVTDLLDYGRIEAGQVAFDVAPVPLHSVIEAVIPMVMPQMREKSLELDYATCPDEVVGIADQAKAVQIVLNLLSNAVKFTPAGGRIAVSCERSGERVGITVKDTGPGIPADKREAIFEPFVQLGRSLTSRHEGTGLGLAISRDLARAMGGDVTVESEVGKGAAFTLWLKA